MECYIGITRFEAVDHYGSHSIIKHTIIYILDILITDWLDILNPPIFCKTIILRFIFWQVLLVLKFITNYIYNCLMHTGIPAVYWESGSEIHFPFDSDFLSPISLLPSFPLIAFRLSINSDAHASKVQFVNCVTSSAEEKCYS